MPMPGAPFPWNLRVETLGFPACDTKTGSPGPRRAWGFGQSDTQYARAGGRFRSK